MSAHTVLEAFRTGRRPSFDDCVHHLHGLFPLLGQFRDTPQDPEWHAEGDVHIHTAMVLDALYTVLETTDLVLSAAERDALFLGAVLHDLAKPLTTTRTEIRGVSRIAAPGHEARGRSLAAAGLIELDLPYPVVRDVMALIGYHQVPKRLVAKNLPPAAWRNLARKAPVRLLYLLEQADMRGRVCPDQEDQLACLELFREENVRHGLWDRPAYQDWYEELYPALPPDEDLVDHAVGRAVMDHEAGIIAVPAEGLARSHLLRSGFGRLYLLAGPSGSGKSTWMAQNVPDAVQISLDALRHEMAGNRSDQGRNGEVRQQSVLRLKRALAARKTVVWDATNLRADVRRPLLTIAHDYAALSTLVVVHRPYTAVLAGNRQREHAVPERVLAQQFARWQWPEEDEAHRMWVVGEGGARVHSAGSWPR